MNSIYKSPSGRITFRFKINLFELISSTVKVSVWIISSKEPVVTVNIFLDKTYWDVSTSDKLQLVIHANKIFVLEQ